MRLRRTLTHKGKWKQMSHWIWIDTTVGILMNDNDESRHNGGGPPHGEIWRIFDSIQEVEAPQWATLWSSLLQNQGKFQRESLGERSHKSYVTVEMQRLHICNSLISLGILCCQPLGCKNRNLPAQLSLLLFVSKISTPGTHSCSLQTKNYCFD